MTACRRCCYTLIIFFFNDPATTEIYTLSLHDALPISKAKTTNCTRSRRPSLPRMRLMCVLTVASLRNRSEEHTSELQSRPHLVCRLLLEKKKIRIDKTSMPVFQPYKYTHLFRR